MVRKRHNLVQPGAGGNQVARKILVNNIAIFSSSLPPLERKGNPTKLYSGLGALDPDNLKLFGKQTKELGKIGTQAVKSIVTAVQNVRNRASSVLMVRQPSSIDMNTGRGFIKLPKTLTGLDGKKIAIPQAMINVDGFKLHTNVYLRATPSVGTNARTWMSPVVRTGAFDFGAAMAVSMIFPEADEGTITWSVPFVTTSLGYYYQMANQAYVASEGIITLGTTTRLSFYHLADKTGSFARVVATRAIPLKTAATRAAPIAVVYLGYAGLAIAGQTYAESNRRYHKNKEKHYQLKVMLNKGTRYNKGSSSPCSPVDSLTGKEIPLSFGWEQVLEATLTPTPKSKEPDLLTSDKSLLSQGR